MIRKLSNFTIASRLIFWFIVISIIPLTAILLVTYKISKDTLSQALRDHLLAITNNKVSQMASFAAERNKDATTLAQMPDVLRAINSLNASSNPQQLEQVRSFFQTYINTYGYDDLILISNSGTVLYCIDCGSLTGSNLYSANLERTGLAKVFDHARTLLETEFSDFQYDPAKKSASAYIAAPVLDHEMIQGVVALRMNQNQITNIVEDYTGLGDTGETVLGQRIGNEVWFVAASRHDPAAAFHRKISVQSGVGLPLVRATDGTRGDGILLDYRGNEVMGVWRYLPYFRWGMVVKMDTHEFFAPLIYQRNLMMFFGVIVLLFVILSALTVANSLSRPVVQLTEIANVVSAGDLTAKMSADQSSQDEVSILTRGFSRMTSNLLRLISGVKHSGSEVSSSSQQIATAARQLEATVNEQAASTNEVVATSKQISATSQDLVRVVTEVSEEGNRATSMVESGRRGLLEMETAMQKLVTATAVISRQLHALNEKASGISTVVTAINRVADQTNLLSLNAAIEAEKAGEAGLGFGVVASEIRRLADQTGFATMDIEQIVREMQAAVDAGVLNIQRFTGDVHKGVEKVQNVSRELSTIIEKVQSLTPRYEEVRTGILSQSMAAEQISEAMIHLSDAAQYTSESVRSLNKITTQLNDASVQLQEEIQRFKVSEE